MWSSLKISNILPYVETNNNKTQDNNIGSLLRSTPAITVEMMRKVNSFLAYG